MDAKVAVLCDMHAVAAVKILLKAVGGSIVLPVNAGTVCQSAADVAGRMRRYSKEMLIVQRKSCTVAEKVLPLHSL